MKKILIEGNRPLVALTQNTEVIQRRYEALYDRELYKYLPGDVVDAIVGLSGSVAGICMLTATATSVTGGISHNPILSKTRTDHPELFQGITKLEAKLDQLYDQIEKLRSNVA
jgi:hypothetical protein